MTPRCGGYTENINRSKIKQSRDLEQRVSRSRKGVAGIHFEVKGEGPDLVMLRGLGRNMKHWLGFDKLAAKHFRVITIDARGLGESRRTMSFADTIYDLADDVIRVLDETGTASTHVMGVSLGGMVAMAMGLKHPARTSSLVLVNSSIAGSGHLRLSVPATMLLLRAVAQGDKIYGELARLLLGPDASEQKRQKLAREWLKIDTEMKVTPGLVAKQLLAAARFRVRDELTDLRVPTLVLCGTGDQFVPRENSKVIAGLIPGSTLLEVDGAGHELTMDHPDQALEAIKGFIKGNQMKARGAKTRKKAEANR
jgi:3-oxoadipate enol-lactonase